MIFTVINIHLAYRHPRIATDPPISQIPMVIILCQRLFIAGGTFICKPSSVGSTDHTHPLSYYPWSDFPSQGWPFSAFSTLHGSFTSTLPGGLGHMNTTRIEQYIKACGSFSPLLASLPWAGAGVWRHPWTQGRSPWVLVRENLVAGHPQVVQLAHHVEGLR